MRKSEKCYPQVGRFGRPFVSEHLRQNFDLVRAQNKSAVCLVFVDSNHFFSFTRAMEYFLGVDPEFRRHESELVDTLYESEKQKEKKEHDPSGEIPSVL
jgi:hypothetical protein